MACDSQSKSQCTVASNTTTGTNHQYDLMTTGDDYQTGTDEEGVRFCPTIKTMRGRTKDKSIENFMREWSEVD